MYTYVSYYVRSAVCHKKRLGKTLLLTERNTFFCTDFSLSLCVTMQNTNSTCLS